MILQFFTRSQVSCKMKQMALLMKAHATCSSYIRALGCKYTNIRHRFYCCISAKHVPPKLLKIYVRRRTNKNFLGTYLIEIIYPSSGFILQQVLSYDAQVLSSTCLQSLPKRGMLYEYKNFSTSSTRPQSPFFFLLTTR